MNVKIEQGPNFVVDSAKNEHCQTSPPGIVFTDVQTDRQFYYYVPVQSNQTCPSSSYCFPCYTSPVGLVMFPSYRAPFE